MKLKGPARTRALHGLARGLTLERPRPRGLWKRRCQFHLGMTGRSAARGALTHCGVAPGRTWQESHHV